MDTMSDRKALELCQSDSDHGHAAFRVIYDRYFDRIHSYAKKLVWDPLSVDEVVQETFVRLYRSRHKVDPDRPLRPYLLKIAHNVSLTLLQRKGKRRAQELTQESEPKAPSADASAEQRELGQGIDQALKTLAPEHRAVIILRHVQKLKLTEIAEALSCSERTARNRLKAAATLFARKLKTLGHLEADVTAGEVNS